MQLTSGGWGWFSGRGVEATKYNTAIVVSGLIKAKQMGVNVDETRLEKGVNWLRRAQKLQINTDKKLPVDNVDAFVAMSLSHTEKVAQNQELMLVKLFEGRSELSIYGKVMLGLALDQHARKDDQWHEQLKIVVRGIMQFLESDPDNGTAFLRLKHDRHWWNWYEDDVETQASFLKLLVRIQPKNKNIEKLARYLMNNRESANHWKSTRDTAVVIDALTEYIELKKDTNKIQGKVSVSVDGKIVSRETVDSNRVFQNDFKFNSDSLVAGKHKVVIEKSKNLSIFYSGTVNYFSTEEKIKATGLDITVTRNIYKYCNERNTNVGKKKACRVKLKSESEVKSGDELEVELVVESKNDYEYILVEDMKAAGVEAVNPISGYQWGRLPAYVEYRDNRVLFFVNKVSRGRQLLSYRVRAEAPGRFSALPAKVKAMYSPSLQGNSDEYKLIISD